MHQKKLLTTALVASTIAGIGIVPAQNAEAASISSFVSNALAIANDNSHGYSMVNRWGPDYDCSSFVITCLKQAGFETGGATYSGNMVSNLTQHGFSYIPSSKIDLSSSSSLQAGDILMASGHTEIYIGNGKRVGAHLNYDGKTGDSGGNEISVLNYSRGSWYGILRYTGSGSTAAAVTTAATTAATTTSSGQTGNYKVNANLNLRSGNSTSTSILTTIPKGTSVTVSQVSNGWGKTTYSGKTGWIYLSYATQTGNTAATAAASTPVATTAATTAAATTTVAGTTYKTTANLNVRSGNSTSTSILTSIPKGTSVTVTEVKNNWGKTSYGGKTGWISLDYAAKTGGTTTAAATTAATKTTTATTAAVAGTVYKTNGYMYLRSSNNKTASVLGVIPKGTSVTATQISNNWGKITYGGKTGWMSLKYSTKTGTVAAPAATTANATTTKATTASTASATVAGTTSKTTSFIYQVTSNLNLRSGNSTSYAKLGVVPRGTAVTVTEVKNNWGKISYGGKTGWVSLQYASKKGSNVVTTINTVVKNAASSTTKTVTYTYMTTANLNLRKSYSTASAKLLTMPKGTSLTVTEIKNDWGKVNYQGNVGWMSLQYAICTGSQTTVKNIIGETSASPTLKTASVPATTSTVKTASVAATTSTAKTASVAATTPAVKTASVAASASAVKLTASAAPVTLASTAESASVTDTEKTNESAEAVETKPVSFSMPVSVVNAFEDEEKTAEAQEAKVEETVAEEAAVEEAASEEAAVEEAAVEEAAVEEAAAEETVAEEAVEAATAEEAVAEEAASEETEAVETEAEEATVEEAVPEETEAAETEAEEAAPEEAEAAEIETEEAEAEDAEEDTEEVAGKEAEESADAFEAGNYAAQKEIRIYADASEGAAVLTTFEAGTVLEVTAENDGWGKVSIDGQTCWIRLSDCEKTDGAVTQGLTLTSESRDEEAVEAEDANADEQAGEAEDANADEQAGEDESSPEVTEDQAE